MKEKPQIELTDKEVDELNTTFGLHFTREEWLLKLTTRPSYESLVRSYYQWHVSDLMSRIPEGCPVPPNLSDVQAPYPPIKLTTRPSYESLVRSYYQWHVSDLMSRIPEGCPVPPNLSDVQAPYPPILQGYAESEARRRAGLFLIQTIRPIREDNEALLEREKLLSAPLPNGERAESEARRRAGLFLIQTIRPIREDNEALLEREKLLSAPLPNGERPDAPFMRRVIYLAGAWYHRVDAMDADGQAALKAYLLKAWPPYQGEPITQTRLEDWRLSDYVIGITKENSTLN